MLASIRRVTGVCRVCSTRSISSSPIACKLFDRIIPEDDAALKKEKDLERQAIDRRMSRSKFAEMFTSGKEKLFVSTPELKDVTSAGAFPDVSATPLEGGRPFPIPGILRSSKATLVTVAFQAIGQAQLQAWHDSYMQSCHPRRVDLQGSAAQPALINLLYLEGKFFSFFSTLFIKSSKQALKPDIVPFTSIIFEPSAQAADHFCERLAIHNRVMAHVFLVDNQGRIRWRAHSAPETVELESLQIATRSLLLQ